MTAVVPAALPAFEALRERGLLHSHALHVRSSQTFALNLLAPLTLDAWNELGQHLLDDPGAIVDQPPEFEYIDRADELNEATRASAHTTQVDCLVRVRRGDGRLHVLLIKVKLSEDTFSTCSAAMSPGNTRTQICGQPGPFGGDTVGCFQLSNHDREQRRRYDVALGPTHAELASFGCWFRDGANQVMRNVALSKILIERGEASTASMALITPDNHTAIWEQWHRHTRYLAA
ncbi:PGN_0703 family putative restriction endonuclease [Gemmatimonas sp.]|uniref:PGN_0703 family putative restriction endonuclease n=1 Tax=Gemmatimonas sp. TaxID=1962908 RepID=UPI0035639DB3